MCALAHDPVDFVLLGLTKRCYYDEAKRKHMKLQKDLLIYNQRNSLNILELSSKNM
jgi:hypothetical protein